MAFTLESFSRWRPYLYHLTHPENLAHIRKKMELRSASSIASEAGVTEQLATKRKCAWPIVLGNHTVFIKDQRPLHAGNIRFEAGWTFEDLLNDLHRRIFFWPGNEEKPIDYGRRHFERYAAELPVLVRFKTNEVFRGNAPNAPQFCRYNSGSPRCSNGQRSPRGPNTFQCGEDFPGSPSKVVEVTYLNEVALPAFEVGRLSEGHWRRTEEG